MPPRDSDRTTTAPPRAAAPTVGILVLVALTVVVGAAIGTFVLGVDRGPASSAPESTFRYAFSDGGDGFDNANDRVRITYAEGRVLQAESIRIVVDGERVDGVAGNWSTEIGTGESIVITDDGTDSDHASVSAIQSGDGILIVWTGDGSGEGVIISSVEVP